MKTCEEALQAYWGNTRTEVPHWFRSVYEAAWTHRGIAEADTTDQLHQIAVLNADTIQAQQRAYSAYVAGLEEQLRAAREQLKQHKNIRCY